MSPVIWSGRGGRGKKAKGRKEQRMRGINDRETLISGPSGDFFAARGHFLDVSEGVVKNCRWTRIDTLSLIEV